MAWPGQAKHHRRTTDRPLFKDYNFLEIVLCTLLRGKTKQKLMIWFRFIGLSGFSPPYWRWCWWPSVRCLGAASPQFFLFSILCFYYFLISVFCFALLLFSSNHCATRIKRTTTFVSRVDVLVFLWSYWPHASMCVCCQLPLYQGCCTIEQKFPWAFICFWWFLFAFLCHVTSIHFPLIKIRILLICFCWSYLRMSATTVVQFLFFS